jgi:hypothetical protein
MRCTSHRCELTPTKGIRRSSHAYLHGHGKGRSPAPQQRRPEWLLRVKRPGCRVELRVVGASEGTVSSLIKQVLHGTKVPREGDHSK